MDFKKTDMALSLDTNVFKQENFNVDKFLQEEYSKYGLHKLHKELGAAVKYIHILMMDLVNGECSMIVNLSSDLKVLQYRFDSISLPLGQFKEEVLQIYKIINEILSKIKQILEHKEVVTSEKSLKIYELRITISSQKISRILASHMKDSVLNMEILERSIDQYILQQMCYQNCNIKLKMSQSVTVLNQILNNMFLKSILENNISHINRCLKMYMLMNTQNMAEQVYANKVIKPALQEIITENALNKPNGNLEILYTNILFYIREKVLPFLNTVNKLTDISGFNFMLNAVWLEIHQQLKITSIYAPGNPTIFQQRFTQTCHFLQEFEQCFQNDTERATFIQHPSLMTHKQQWNLNVYYEIRHLEIVRDLEDTLTTSVTTSSFINDRSNTFKLVSSLHIWKLMQRCFELDVYLPQILDKFWKLNLHILARIGTWVEALLNDNVPVMIDDQIGESDMKSQEEIKLKFLTYLYCDILQFNNKIEHPFTSGLTYLTVVPEHIRYLFIESLIDPQNQFHIVLTLIEDKMIETIYTDCATHLQNISRIPRLFRKTNRSSPTVPSEYLTLISKPIDKFKDTYKMCLDDGIMSRILTKVHTKIISEYKTLAENVLTSITKTEQSLKKLKKIRNSNDNSDSPVVSDYQKIKEQVQIDLMQFSKQTKQYVDESILDELMLLLK